MSDAVAVPIPTSSRIKRNTACTSCRDAKVRCNPSSQPSQPCQRCNKLELECVVDRTHKRVSRRNKIDELVQEIQTIKQTVGSSHPTGGIIATPFAKDLPPVVPLPVIHSPNSIRPSLSDKTVASGASVTETPATTATTTTTTTTTTLVGDVPTEPSLPRALGSQPFSGEDIDYYFNMYFEHFHPYMPIVRHRDPNKCYDSAPVLFWTILLVACRRYAKTPQVLPFLVDAMKRELSSVLSSFPVGIHTINALILVCTWVFPDVRFVHDPTCMFSGVIMNASLLLGIQTGKGSNPAFSFGGFQNHFTDEEAHYTWAGYNIVTQRSSHYMGLPPFGSLFNQTVQNVIDGRTPFHVPSSFRVLLECQKFAHRVSKTMSACLEESEGVSSYIVQQIEDDFDNIRGLICSERADDMDKFNALLVQLEIQTYYLMPLPGYNPEALQRNILRAYSTAQAVLRDALRLDDRHRFLQHMPHFYFRSLLSAMCIVYKIFRSSYQALLDPQAAARGAADCLAVCRRSVVQEGDLGARLAVLFESFWSLAQSAGAVWPGEPTVTAGTTRRMAAGVCFDCLLLWKNDVNARKPRSTQTVEGGEGGGRSSSSSSSSNNNGGGGGDGDALVTTGAATLGSGTAAAAAAPGSDPLVNIDWSFMEDFDWDCEPSLLAPMGLGT